MAENVVVMGASSKPEKYSNQAVLLLKECGHRPFPVHPSGFEVAGEKCYKSLAEIDEKVDTVTMYLGEKNSTPLKDDIVKIGPRRVIINPGAENDALERTLAENGIEVLRACTLVLLRTGQY